MGSGHQSVIAPCQPGLADVRGAPSGGCLWHSLGALTAMRKGRGVPEVLRSGDLADIDGYAGRVFGGVTQTPGSSLPLARGMNIRTRAVNLIQQIEAEEIAKASKEIPEFRAGDTLRVGVRVVEGERTRVQAYEGVCIARSNKGIGSNFTVRKMSFGEGVERVFPLYSPNIESIVVVRRGVVRRAKLYYLRGRTGKRARIAERKITRTGETGQG